MSYQTFEAVRIASATRGAMRAVAYTAATYADEWGHGIYPSHKTLCAGANAARNTVKGTFTWMCANGEADFIGRRRHGNAEHTFAPLHDRLEQINYWLPIFEYRGGSTTDPPDSEEGQALTEGGQSQGLGGQSLDTGGSTTDPEPSVKPLVESVKEKNSPLSDLDSAPAPLALHANEQLEGYFNRQVERAGSILDASREVLPETTNSRFRATLVRGIERAEGALATEAEIDRWADRLVAA